MSDEAVIKVRKVSKSFRLPHDKARSLKTLFVNVFNKKSYEIQNVLKNVSLEVRKGEFLGIVGRNGSGKSTLLKILAGVYVPDTGSIEINGKLTPFIELGVGFDPELSGKDNVYLNGALLGFSKKEMSVLYKEIVDFAELENFMDQKLKNYSSGMKVRLAFSVAIQARTAILLIDEVLAVGDANFQKKCLNAFEEFKKEGRTIVFVSHSMDAIRRFCDRAILIDKGRIKVEGEPDIVATEYDLLNNEKQKGVKNRLKILNRRESHIVDRVFENFEQEERLLEIGAAEGRHIDLLRSMGINTIGVDTEYGKHPKDGNKTTVYKQLSYVPDIDRVTGLLLLDNKKTINKKFLNDIFEELNKGKLQNIKKIYVHLPFHLYQKYAQHKDSQALDHLGPPLDMNEVSKLLRKYDFVDIESGTYGTDLEHQYAEGIYERFDQRTESSLWDS